MKTRRITAVTGLVAGATVLGIVGGSVAYGVWNGGVAFESTTTTGSLALAVSDRDGQGGKQDWSTRAGAKVDFALPNGSDARGDGPLKNLNVSQPTVASFIVKGTSSGRQGVDFAFGRFMIDQSGQTTKDDSLLEATSVKFYSVPKTASCTAGAAVPAGAKSLYSGGLLGLNAGLANIATQKVVESQPWSENTETLQYCLYFSAGESLTGQYSNTVTVEGSTDAGTKVSASDSWNAFKAAPTANARNVKLGFTLAPERTRPAKATRP